MQNVLRSLIYLSVVFFLVTSISFASDSKIVDLDPERIKAIRIIGASHSIIQMNEAPWVDLQPYLTKLIHNTFKTKVIEEHNFCFQVTRDDCAGFYEWYNSLRKTLRYPLGIRMSNVRVEGEKVDGVYDIYHRKLTLLNYSRREESARQVNEYKFFGGKLNKSLLNEETFYNLMARVGYKTSDFKKGCTGLQGRILLKPFQLVNLTHVAAFKELEGILSLTSIRAFEKHITFVINLPPEAQYTVSDILSDRNSPLFVLNRNFKSLAIIREDSENRIYLSILNDRRKILDLHGFDKAGEFNGIGVEGARKLVINYITEQYNNFQSGCIILTGKGNHTNPNGSNGVLRSAFPIWMQGSEIKPLVQKTFPVMGGGAFKILLKKPRVCDITKSQLKADPLEVVFETLKIVIDSADDRLLIKTTDLKLDQKLIIYLFSHRKDLKNGIPELSFHRVPGELRLTIGRVSKR